VAVISGRASGILLHVTSLPSAYGIGDLGPEAFRFVDTLARLNQRFWSILPLTPTRLEDDNSPYQAPSSFAGNTALISPHKFSENGFLPKPQVQTTTPSTVKVNYPAAYTQKDAFLRRAYSEKTAPNVSGWDFAGFCEENKKWLEDYALYAALRQKTGKPWFYWSASLRRREPSALAEAKRDLKDEMDFVKFTQFHFFCQWRDLKAHCKKNLVKVVGDMPIYVAYDSADVWVHPELFKLNPEGKPLFVAGVPPDYFSESGQLWGNPVYDWQKHEETGFEWWVDRIRHNLALYDVLRLDHFRGFVAYWQVSGNAKTAKNGRWIKAPSKAFFRTLKAAFPTLPFIAEDLGDIDDEVRSTIKRLEIPGMRVLLFAFDGKNSPYLPQNHPPNSVVYTGTHDTNTVRGWFTGEASAKQKQNFSKLVGGEVSAQTASFEMAKIALKSPAELCIIPLQDVLGLGSDARMNKPGGSKGNWQWRVTPQQLESKAVGWLGGATVGCGRAS
jgi:4-alpha-glucanotransferase